VKFDLKILFHTDNKKENRMAEVNRNTQKLLPLIMDFFCRGVYLCAGGICRYGYLSSDHRTNDGPDSLA